MNILSISMILPLPGFRSANDFVFQTYIHFKHQYENDTVVIIKPVKLDLNLVSLFKKETSLKKIKKSGIRKIHGFRTEILPFLSSWRFRNIHAVISSSLYYLHINRLKNLFSSCAFDIIHAQYIFPDGWLAYLLSRKYKIPYVLTTHNERFYFEHFISRKFAIKIMKKSSGIFPINYSNYQYYISLKLNHIKLIPLGFNRNFIRNQKKDNLNNTVKILTVAELIKLKNIDKVLYAVKELVLKYDITYTIIGRGPEKEVLQNTVNLLRLENYVTFIDYIPYAVIADKMYEHDIFIMPSYFETFGRVYFEAMAMGIPVICAKNSGIYGIFRNMEEGISVDHESVPEIIQALEFLITNPEERLRIGANGKKIVEKYTWDNIAKDLHDKYAEIISKTK
jgi:teichuronic acid biosynthesis glycosyltransferase TuaC